MERTLRWRRRSGKRAQRREPNRTRSIPKIAKGPPLVATTKFFQPSAAPWRRIMITKRTRFFSATCSRTACNTPTVQRGHTGNASALPARVVLFRTPTVFTIEKCASDLDCNDVPTSSCSTALSNDCGCHDCVPSQCTTDGDCDAAQTCGLDMDCLGGALGYFCTTSLDQCAASADCGGSECDYVDDRWQCVTDCPLTP